MQSFLKETGCEKKIKGFTVFFQVKFKIVSLTPCIKKSHNTIVSHLRCLATCEIQIYKKM